MSRDIAIYGAGGLGKEVACLIDRINQSASEPAWNLIGFFDDGKPKGTPISHYGEVLGGADEINAWQEPLDLVVAIGVPQSIEKVVRGINNHLISFPNLIDPTLMVVDAETFSIGCGNVIAQNCLISCDTSIGDFNLLNGNVMIGHDVSIGNYNSIMPRVNVSGEVKIGNGNFLGVGAIVLQQIEVGDRIRLGANSVLMTKPKDDCLYIGNPAKRFEF